MQIEQRAVGNQALRFGSGYGAENTAHPNCSQSARIVYSTESIERRCGVSVSQRPIQRCWIYATLSFEQRFTAICFRERRAPIRSEFETHPDSTGVVFRLRRK